MKRLLELYRVSDDPRFLEELRTLFLKEDYLSAKHETLDLVEVKKMAERILAYRKIDEAEGRDGLDSVRHNLRLLRQANLPDTRLIVCNMADETMYPAVDKLLAEDEFQDTLHRLVITVPPAYLAQFTSSNLVISYQRRFLNAAKGQS